MGRLKPRGIVPQGLSQVSHGGQVTLRSHRVKALVRGGWHGPMRGNAKRLASPIGDRCIRHGPITLIPGERPDLNFTISLPCLGHICDSNGWSFQASNEVMEVEPPSPHGAAQDPVPSPSPSGNRRCALAWRHHARRAARQA